MSLFRVVFPAESRRLPAQRWINIGLRSLHLLGTAGLGGAYLYQAPESAWLPYFWLAMVSGVLMALIHVWNNGVWLIQVRGLAILFKLLLLALIGWLEGADLPLFILVILISGVIAHAPGDLRYYSPWHGRRVEKL
ncbi:hypothetical protein DFR31_0041 [Alkalispirillum mobile]|uniref:Uncharacterized protein n=1 Tax=Alkalispirillum mobile TaxID=85925 RepID=A0A498C3S1_9GAMM|nr:hypothetical protein [Alkalispirillum mobile]RLK50152.1 hypothetical protein DFR31_0041 [Alkalispirillum mobile]